MKAIRRLANRVRFAFFGRQDDAAMTEELESHIQMQSDENLRAGMSPEEARRLAVLKFGAVESVKESYRDQRSLPLLETLQQDLRQAVRVLKQSRGWSVAAVLTLALGIAPFTAFYSLIERTYAPIPVERPDELVFMGVRSVDLYEKLRHRNTTLSGLVAYDRYGSRISSRRIEVLAEKRLVLAKLQFVSGNFYSVLGVGAIRGRPILPEDDRPSSIPVAMISEPFWVRELAANPNVIGSTIKVRGKSFAVVGVWPTEFIDPSGQIYHENSMPIRPDIAIPLAHHPELGSLALVGRMKPGVTLGQVNAETRTILTSSLHTQVSLFRKQLYGIRAISEFFRSRPIDVAFFTVVIVGFFAVPLFLSCTNIATYLLSRGEDRRVEIALRLSLGASRSRIIRQLLAESVLLAALGGVAGCGFAYWWTRILSNPPFSAFGNLPMQWGAFVFVALLVLPVGLACGVLPAKDATRNAADMMRTFGVHFSRSKSERPRNLMTIQVAVSFFGLFCVGLMLRTVQVMNASEVRYDIDRIATFSVNTNAGARQYDKDGLKALYERVVSAVSAAPGVEAVSFSDESILNGNPPVAGLYAWDQNRHLQTRDARWLTVDNRFFATMGLSFKLGEKFAATDSTSTQSVVINEALAQSMFPNRNPLGIRFGRTVTNLEAFEIVGVVADPKPSAATPAVYANSVCCRPSSIFEVRTAGPPSAIVPFVRAALHEMDPDLPISRISTLQEEMAARSLNLDGPIKLVLNYYAGLSTILVVVGVFGLMSHSVARRTREIGIRMAIGAPPREVLRTVIREAIVLVVPGVIVGLAITLALGRYLTSYVDLKTFDPPVIVGSILMMFVIASVSGFLPARRASRVDPVIALREN